MHIQKLKSARRQAATLIGLVCTITLIALNAAHAVDIKTVTSSKGIKALLVEDYTVPLVALQFSFKGGASQDNEGKEGAANLLTTMLDEGAGDIESKEFQIKLDDVGMTYKFGAGRDYFTGGLKTLKSNASDSFELMRLMLNAPRFDAEPVGRMKAALTNGLQREKTDPRSIAGKALREAVFKTHPYSRPGNGTVESLDTITREDLVDYHKRVFARENLIIGVVGAISAGDLKSVLDKIFGDLPEKAGLNPVPEFKVETGGTVHVDLPVPQTSITFALPGIKRDDPNFYTAYLVNYVLGGGTFSSRLYEEVREKRGLAYGVYSYLGTYDHAGMIGAGSATGAQNAGKTVEIIKAEMARMAKEGPTAEELEKAKKYITGSYAISNLDTSDKIASVLVAIQQADLGTDYIDKRADYISSVTLEDAKRVAKKLFAGKPTQITVGKPL